MYPGLGYRFLVLVIVISGSMFCFRSAKSYCGDLNAFKSDNPSVRPSLLLSRWFAAVDRKTVNARKANSKLFH